MTEQNGLEEAILLRTVDRLVTAEQQIATSVASVKALTETVAELRRRLDGLTAEMDRMSKASDEEMHAFEQMRRPLEGLLILKQRISGGWLVIVALVMALSYLLEPVLSHLDHLRPH